MLKDKFVIVRSITAGIFVGRAMEVNDGSVILENARQIYQWESEPTLSHIANDGFLMPESVKMSPMVRLTKIENVCQIIGCNEHAIESISDIPVWQGDGEVFNNYFGYGIAWQNEPASSPNKTTAKI